MLGRDGSVPPVTIDLEGSQEEVTRRPAGIFVGSPELPLESLEESCRSFLPVEGGSRDFAVMGAASGTSTRSFSTTLADH